MGKGSSFILVLASISIWSLWPVLIRIFSLPPFHLSVILLFGSSLLCVFLYPFKRPRGFGLFLKKLHIFIATSVALFLNVLFYFKALRGTFIPIAVITHYTAPIFVAIFAPLIIGEHRSRHIWFSILLSMMGLSLALFSGVHGTSSLTGGLFGLLSGLFYGLGAVFTKGLLDFFDPYSYLYFASLVSIPLYIPVLVFVIRDTGLDVVTWALPLSFFMSLAPAIMYLSGLSRLSVQSVSVMSYMEPFLAILWGFVVFGEGLTCMEALGGILVFVSSYLVIKGES